MLLPVAVVLVTLALGIRALPRAESAPQRHVEALRGANASGARRSTSRAVPPSPADLERLVALARFAHSALRWCGPSQDLGRGLRRLDTARLGARL